MKIGWIIIWFLLAIAFTGYFFNGWFTNNLWDQIFIGLMALGSWLGFIKSVIN